MYGVTTAATAGHVFFELAAGVGLPLASVLGPFTAATAWTAWRAAATRPARDNPMFAVLGSISLAAVMAHLDQSGCRPRLSVQTVLTDGHVEIRLRQREPGRQTPAEGQQRTERGTHEHRG